MYNLSKLKHQSVWNSATAYSPSDHSFQLGWGPKSFWHCQGDSKLFQTNFFPPGSASLLSQPNSLQQRQRIKHMDTSALTLLLSFSAIVYPLKLEIGLKNKAEVVFLLYVTLLPFKTSLPLPLPWPHFVQDAHPPLSVTPMFSFLPLTGPWQHLEYS